MFVPLSLQQVLDTNGAPIRTARLYVYQTGTTTPATVYASGTLDPARLLPWPVPVDGTGRLPAIFVGQGNYDLLVTNGTSPDPVGAPGAVLYSGQNLPGDPIPSTTPAFDPLRQYKTGDYILNASSGGRDGAVSANGGTIGSAQSGATNRANADCEALFVLLWQSCPYLTVSPARGGSAEGDFAAGNTIRLPDLNSRLLAFVAPGSPSGNLLAAGLQDPASPTGVLLGSFGGKATHVLTENELASHAHTATFAGTPVLNHAHVADVGVDSPAHTHINQTIRKQVNSAAPTAGAIPTSWYAFPDGEGSGALSPTLGPTQGHQHTVTIEPAGGHTPAGQITVATDGASAAHNNLPPFIVAGAVYIKL